NILAIDGKVVARGNPAARAQWKIFGEPVGLPQVRPLVRIAFDGSVSFERRRDCWIADGEASDFCRSVEIAIQKSRRHQERIGVGVEAMRLLIGRQHGRRIDLDPDQIATRIRIFCAVEAVEARDRKSTRLNSSHVSISYAVFCLKKKNKKVDAN